MDLYLKVKELCDQNRTTVQTLEQQTGMSGGTIGKWRLFYPRADRLAAVADYFGVSMDWLMGRTLRDLSPRALEIARAYDQADDKSRALARMALIEEISSEKERDLG